MYASNDFQTRLRLWRDLYCLSNSADIEWLVAGDFNKILHASKKLGGNLINRSRAKHFWNCLQNC